MASGGNTPSRAARCACTASAPFPRPFEIYQHICRHRATQPEPKTALNPTRRYEAILFPNNLANRATCRLCDKTAITFRRPRLATCPSSHRHVRGLRGLVTPRAATLDLVLKLTRTGSSSSGASENWPSGIMIPMEPAFFRHRCEADRTFGGAVVPRSGRTSQTSALLS